MELIFSRYRFGKKMASIGLSHIPRNIIYIVNRTVGVSTQRVSHENSKKQKRSSLPRSIESLHDVTNVIPIGTNTFFSGYCLHSLFAHLVEIRFKHIVGDVRVLSHYEKRFLSKCGMTERSNVYYTDKIDDIRVGSALCTTEDTSV